jgi:hypothetical protein
MSHPKKTTIFVLERGENVKEFIMFLFFIIIECT